jgi:hypothetical protein
MNTVFVKKLNFRKLCVWAEKVTRSNVIETNVIREKVIAILSLPVPAGEAGLEPSTREH